MELFKIVNGNLSIGTLKGLSTMALDNFVRDVVLKILYNLVSMQNSVNPDNYSGKKNFGKCPFW